MITTAVPLRHTWGLPQATGQDIDRRSAEKNMGPRVRRTGTHLAPEGRMTRTSETFVRPGLGVRNDLTTEEAS